MMSLFTTLWELLWKWILLTLLPALLLTGCATPDAHVQMFFEKVGVPVVLKIVEENPIEAATVEGDVQGVEPGYTAEFEGYWVTGLKGKVTLYAKGVSGRLGGHANFGKAAETPKTE
jgi:hypothetical protein